VLSVMAPPIASLATEASPPSVCSGGTVHLVVMGTEVGVSYRAMLGSTPIGAVQNGNGGTLSFTSPPITEDTNFTISATRAPCATATLAHAISVLRTPDPAAPMGASASPASICLASPPSGGVLLSVNGGSGTDIHWFTTECGAVEIGVGNPFTLTD